LAELENIDTQADKMNIAFVKICDLELVDEYGLTSLPAIVYYRQTIPIPYEGTCILVKIFTPIDSTILKGEDIIV
jgi:hypothetical protein